MTRTPKRPVGRPARSATRDVRSALTGAARELFARHGYHAVSLRAVAEAAGVNPAMIHYYFGDKDGLYEAVLEETIGPLFARLQELTARPGERRDIRVFLEAYTTVLADNPWLPSLMLREVLPEEGRLRERFIQQFAARGGGLLRELMKRRQAEGLLHPDLDPKLATLSLISLTLFPFLGFPVAREVLDLKMNRAFVRRLVDHTEQLFLRGTRP